MIGYFPTYTIGNLMAAQLWRALSDDMPAVEVDIAAGDFGALREWLRDHIHRHGRKFDSRELLRRATGQELRVEPWLAYLEAQAARRRADCAGASSPHVAWRTRSNAVRRRRRLSGGLMSSRQNSIVVSGAREHNLKDVSVTLPRDSLVVITGLSGSGKSSLAFDTIYAEGQRRYVESLSAYARQFLGQMDKPDVDSIEGLSPAISIDQKTTSRNPRSTVGTVTEIYDYLRLLWARIGKPHCFNCGRPIAAQSAEQIIDQIMALEEGTRFMVMAPIVRGRKGEYGKQLAGTARRGVHAREGGRRAAPARGGDRPRQEVQARHLGRGRPPGHAAGPAQAAGRLAWRRRSRSPTGSSRSRPCRGDADAARSTRTRERFACLYCGISMPELEPRSFSFNAPHGACPRCTGLGSMMEIDPELVVPDPSLSINEGAILPWSVGRDGLLRADHAGDRRALRGRRRRAVGDAAGASSATCSCTAPTATSSTSPTATGWAASAPT